MSAVTATWVALQQVPPANPQVYSEISGCFFSMPSRRMPSEIASSDQSSPVTGRQREPLTDPLYLQQVSRTGPQHAEVGPTDLRYAQGSPQALSILDSCPQQILSVLSRCPQQILSVLSRSHQQVLKVLSRFTNRSSVSLAVVTNRPLMSSAGVTRKPQHPQQMSTTDP